MNHQLSWLPNQLVSPFGRSFMQSLSRLSATASSPEAAPPLSLRDVSPTGSTFTKGSLKVVFGIHQRKNRSLCEQKERIVN